MPSGESNTHILMQLSVPLLTITGSLLGGRAEKRKNHVSNAHFFGKHPLELYSSTMYVMLPKPNPYRCTSNEHPP